MKKSGELKKILTTAKQHVKQCVFGNTCFLDAICVPAYYYYD